MSSLSKSNPSLSVPALGSGHRHRVQRLILLVLGGTVCLFTVLALSLGAMPISLGGLLSGAADSVMEKTLLLEIRSPRVVLSLIVGAALAIAGAVLQGLFRNPLADPSLIGVSSGAALGAICWIVLGTLFVLPKALLPFALPVSAILGGVGVTLLLYHFSRLYGSFSIATMLLMGIAINAIALAGIGFFQYLSDDIQLRTLTFWMLGSFGRAMWSTVLPVLVIIVSILVLLLRNTRSLDLLQLGEAEAAHLGIDVMRVKRRIILLSAAIVGAAVSVSGIISFVGLIVPHLVRLLGGVSHAYVLPASALLGAALMVIADLIARTMAIPGEVPVGLITSALGAPFFIWLIAKVRPG